jgi:hypothetical protein
MSQGLSNVTSEITVDNRGVSVRPSSENKDAEEYQLITAPDLEAKLDMVISLLSKIDERLALLTGTLP